MPAVRPPSSFLFYSVYLFGAVTLVFADPNAPVTYQVLLSEDSAVVNDGGDNWEAAAFPKYGPDGTGWVVADWSGIENDFPVGGVGLTVLSGLNEITVQYRERDRGFSGMRQNLIFPTSSGLVFGATPEGDTWQSIYSGNPPQVIEVDGLLEYAGFEGSVVFGDVLPGFKTNFSVIRPNLVTIKLGEIGEAVPGLEGVTFAEFGKINVSNAGHVTFFAKMQGSGIDSTNDWGLFEFSQTNELLLTLAEGGSPPDSPLLDASGVWAELERNKAVFSLNAQGVMAFKASITNAPSGGGTSIWRKAMGQEPTLIAVEGTPTPTDIGEVRFDTFFGAAAFLNPAVDAEGNVYFHGSGSVGQESTGEGIWKHDGATIKRVVVFDELPITVTNTQTSLPYTFTNKGVDVRRVSISETGRLAVAGNLKEGNRTIAGVLWAQDTDGDFIVVAVQNFSPDDNNDGVRDLFFNEELVFVGGELVGDDGTIGTLFVPTTDMTMIGGQDRMGDSWWTPRELLMFSTSLRVNDEFKAFVFQAQVGESDLPPTGDTYIWDGGAGTQDWHTVDGERSNWVDAFGARWPEPPGNKDGSERVIIPLSTRVELNAPVTIRSLNLGGSEPATILELNADLEFATLIEINANSEVILKGGSINSESGNIECEGDITKQGTTNQSISVNTLDMDSVNLKVEGGTLSLNNVESRYDRVNGLVTSGKLNLHSETMIVDGDSELDASNVGATIHVGDGSNIVPLQFSGGSSGTKRKLELNGEGRIEIRRPMIISENEELEVNNNAPWEREGVVINLPSGQVIDVTGEWFFTKEMRLQSGGIVGNFWNDGVLIVKAESAGETLRLSCINTGRIQQYSDINYVTWLKNRPLATYQMFGGTLAPEAEEGHDLIFEANAQGKSRLTSNEGTSALFFNTKEDQNFSGFIETMGSADLSIRNLRLLDSDVTVAGSSRLVLQTTSMQGKARVEVDEQADFILIETEFERLLIEGKGTAIISGKLEAQLAGEGEKDKLLGPFFLNTKKYEFSGADLRSKSGITEFNVGLKYIRIESPLSNSVSGISTFNFDGVLVDAQNLLVDQDGELAATRVGANAVLRMGSANKYSIEDFSVEGKLVIQNGKPTFRYNVTGNGLIEAEPSFDFLTLTDPSVIVFDASNGNAIEVAPQFEVKFLSKVLVREGTKVYLYGTDAFDSSNGTLKVGEWLLEKNAALYFDSTGAQIGATIDIIDSAAALTMAEAAASNGFPARSSDLTVKGRLTLKEGCILQFGGARIEGVITQESGSEVKGALQSVRGELGGVINLAGVITGDTQAGGLTRMGASPGIGVFDGDLLFSETSELEVEMAGTELGQFDQLDVTGNVSLGGKLVLVFLDGYEATGGEQFAVLKASQISGNFSDIDQSRLGRNVRFDFEVGETGLMATAMPLSITSYADWRAAFFTQSDAADDLISGPDQDPENDGSTNRMEYAFGLNPNVPEGSPVTFELTETGNPDEYVVSASFDWANDVTDAIWFFEISDDLEEWTEVAANETGREDNGVFSRIIAALTNPIDGTQRTFLRIGVKDSQ